MFVFALLRERESCSFLFEFGLLRERCSVMNQATTSLMTSASSDRPRLDPPVSLAEFNRWLLRAQPGQQLEYHRGMLNRDRSPASGMSDEHRRGVARVADAALQAAEDGLVHLVQRRNGPFDFSYVAVCADRGRSGRRAGTPMGEARSADALVACPEAA
jgi:hypothetical protein